MKDKFYIIIFISLLIFIVYILFPNISFASYRFTNFKAYPPIHVFKTLLPYPQGLSPKKVKEIYNLPQTGGHGTIAIIGAYDATSIEADLNIFSKAFNLPACTTKNGCFEKHIMGSGTKSNLGWALEISLDVEWAHAIAPKTKILLIEAKTPSGANLLKAIDYAASRKDVVAISMSWGGPEFTDETSLDSHFKSISKASFFASSGDNGTGASWPASSPNVISVGGTTINLKNDSSFISETAWSGSGGGVSAYESEPDYQKSLNIPKANGMRAIPDISYGADPKTGFSVYKTTPHSNGWYVVGGTSAGAPQWAAIQSLGLSATLPNLYKDKISSKSNLYFRDIKSGSNGDCQYYCDARARYDYVTGLGSPLTDSF